MEQVPMWTRAIGWYISNPQAHRVMGRPPALVSMMNEVTTGSVGKSAIVEVPSVDHGENVGATMVGHCVERVGRRRNDVLRSDWDEDHGPTPAQALALDEARHHMDRAKAHLDRAAR